MSRAAIIGLGVVAAVLAVLAGLFYYQYSQLQVSYNELQADYSELQNSYCELQLSHSILQRDYNELQSNYSQLQVLYSELQADYNELQSSYDELLKGYEALLKEYEDLNASYAHLNSAYTQLSTAYASLLEEYSALNSSYTKLHSALYEPLQNKTIPTIQELKDWLKNDPTDSIAYKMPEFICGDYAVMLALHAKLKGWDMGVVGIIGHKATGEEFNHAFNAIICKEGLVYIEPQTDEVWWYGCLLYTSPSPRDLSTSRMPSSA